MFVVVVVVVLLLFCIVACVRAALTRPADDICLCGTRFSLCSHSVVCACGATDPKRFLARARARTVYLRAALFGSDLISCDCNDHDDDGCCNDSQSPPPKPQRASLGRRVELMNQISRSLLRELNTRARTHTMSRASDGYFNLAQPNAAAAKISIARASGDIQQLRLIVQYWVRLVGASVAGVGVGAGACEAADASRR